MLVLTACNIGQKTGNTPPAQAQMPPPAVTVAPVLFETVTEWNDYTGRLEASETVTIRPQVSGTVVNVAFTEGALVATGDLLFEIDARPFEAQVNRLLAELKSAQSRVVLANNDYQRAVRLKKQNAIAAEQVDNRLAERDQAIADKEAIAASLVSARLELSFTKVTAPISGRISRALITAGNFVTAGQSQLTTLVSTAKIYAYFDADEQTFLKYQERLRQPNHYESGGDANPVFMQLANEEEYSHLGYIDFIDNQVNPGTGTIHMRAVFDNSKQQFTPGLFARIKLAVSPQFAAILIKDQAIATDLNNKYVLVLTADSHVEYRTVTLGPKVKLGADTDSLRIIRSGLQATDQIVVAGLQRVRPGSQVQAEITSMASAHTLQKLADQQQLVAASRHKLEEQSDAASDLKKIVKAGPEPAAPRS
jgi:multidrug efflux system membrane fusion protein